MSDFPPNCVAFITGAASGIGKAVAQRLKLDGVHNFALVDLTAAHLADTVESLNSTTGKVLSIGADCSKEAEIENAIAKTVAEYGRIDVCFNAAGISGEVNPIVEMSSENLDRVLDLNLKGVWYCERAQIRQMLSQEMRDLTTSLPFKTRGAIVNVGSLASHIGLNRITPYVMAKHAILGLCKSDTNDYAEQGIRTNAICPGWIKTPFTKMIWDSPQGPAFAARAPMNRFGLPEEVAYLVSFLLSDKSSFIAGTAVDIDGGCLCK